MAFEPLSAGYDTTFELSEFNEPRLRSDLETIKNTLLFVLFAKPGQYPSLPQVGMDIESYLYSFYDEIDEQDLISQITQQCSLVGAYISAGTIQVKKLIYQDQPSLIIDISGKEKFPSNYKHDKINDEKHYLIGLTYDQVQNLLVNINSTGG